MHKYQFTCHKCGLIWTAAHTTGNNKCPKCGTQAFPREVK